MTQFMFIIIFLAIGLGLFGAPFWLAPVFMVAGYVAGYVYQGEILLRRTAAYTIVWTRSLLRTPRLVNIHAEWERVRLQAERRQVGEIFPPALHVD